MSFNKAKSLKAASKYVQQGKYQAAIEEYRKIVQAEPSDITTLNTMGDLYVKIGDNSEAIRTFLRIAEHYRAGSFNLKAIAMLKKVSKLDPGNVEVSLKLAGLYAQQKLIVDARQQYLSVAEHYLRAGQQRQALDIYQRIANLDPENTVIQLKLAEAYRHEQQFDQAYEAYVAAAAEVQRQGKYEEALQIYLKALQIKPEAHGALNAAVNLYVQRGESQRAASLITQLLQTQPNNAELLTLLGRIYQSAGQLADAEKVLARAIAIDPSRFQYLIDFAEVAARNGDFQYTLRQIDLVMERLYERREEEKAIALLHDILAKDPSHFGALERLAAIFARCREDHNLIETLNSLADSAIRKGEDEVAIRALVQLTQLEPDDLKHRRRLRSLGLSDEEVQRLSDSVSQAPARVAPPLPEIPEGAQTIAAPAAPKIELTQTQSSVWGEIDFSALEPQQETPPAVASENAATFTNNSEAEISVAQPETALFYAFNEKEMLETSESEESLWSLKEDAGRKPASEIDLSVDLQGEIVTSGGGFFGNHFAETYSDSHPMTVSAFPTESLPGTALDAAAEFAGAAKVTGGLKLDAELESVDFYIAQEMFDVAQHTIEVLEQHYPGHPGVTARRQQLAQATGTPLAVPQPVSRNAESFTVSQEETREIFILSPGPEEQAQTFGFENGFSPSHPENGSQAFSPVETVRPAGVAIPAAQDIQAGSMFDDLLNDLGSIQFDAAAGKSLDSPPAMSEESSVVVSPTPRPAPAAEAPLNDLFGIFDDIKSGAEAEGEKEDFDTHYNLGLAYKDMEMYDEAVEEFQQAYKAVSSEAAGEVVGLNQLLCCSMLGFCFSQKNMPRPAVMWLKKGLEVPGRSEDEYQALRYDLASAYEALGDLKGAYDVLSEVYAIDVSYRNVSAKMNVVQAQLAQQQ
ncbi:MAG TPA: tetratricopeptide repeat protein [Blastocatellia bacterium]|nr:tetratricopeptide repeat protein [Blastocatellia bacterium]